MKKLLIIAILAAGLMATYSFAHMQGSTMGTGTMMHSQGQQQSGETSEKGGYSPCSHMMGSGMVMGTGMMGGMMGHHEMMGGMMGSGMMSSGYSKENLKPFTKEQIEIILKSRIIYTRNPNLKVGRITEKDDYFEVEIVTKENSLVSKLIVDKYTGWSRSVY